MNYALAIKEFKAFKEDIARTQALPMIHFGNYNPISLVEKLEILLNNFYLRSDPVGHKKFFNSIRLILADNGYSVATKLMRLDEIVDNILVDLNLKQSIASDQGKDKEILTENISLKNQLKTLTSQNIDLKSTLRNTIAELEALKATKQSEMDSLIETHKLDVKLIKQSYQRQIDELKNTPTGFSYKLSFYIVLFLFLSTLTFGVPFMLNEINWFTTPRLSDHFWVFLS